MTSLHKVCSLLVTITWLCTAKFHLKYGDKLCGNHWIHTLIIQLCQRLSIMPKITSVYNSTRWYNTMHYIYVHPKADKGSLICRIQPNKKIVMKKTKTKNEMPWRNGPVTKPWSQSWGQEGSLWWERLVNEVGLEPRVKERWQWMMRVVSWQAIEHEQASHDSYSKQITTTKCNVEQLNKNNTRKCFVAIIQVNPC